jgi:tetratricopeptide (TPR) repeat protein
MCSGRIFPVLLMAALLVSCAPNDRSAVDGVVVFDDDVTLARGERIDSAQRELSVAGNATFVVIAEENDVEIDLRIENQGAQGIPTARVHVNSYLLGAGIEIAVLDASAGSRLTISLNSAQDFHKPSKVRLKILRYGADDLGNPRVAARLAAHRAWCASTGAELSGDELRGSALRDIDVALAHFESADGDASLAAWGRVIRARLNIRQYSNLKTALLDVRTAVRGFDAIGARRNAARARMLEADTLLDLSADVNAKNPSTEEAMREAKNLLNGLTINPALSPFERARAMNYLGVHAYNDYNWQEARVKWEGVLRAYEEIGARAGRRQAFENLGVLAAEEGDYRGATLYLDKVFAESDQIMSIERQIVLLFNSSQVDVNAGNVDRAIERLHKALDLTRQQKLPVNEARVSYGLGRAYLARGDNAQAATFFTESLKLRRTIGDVVGLHGSLRSTGNLARETGDIQKALALHREAILLGPAPDLRIRTLLEIANDYAAANDYQNAIATCREALAVPLGVTDSHKKTKAQAALADVLLAQPRRTPQAVAEAAGLAQTVLDAAIRRADILMEITARRLLAQTRIEHGEPDEAQEEYERAIALIFKYRSAINNPELQAAALAHEQQTFRGYVELMMRDVARRGPNKLLPVKAAEEKALRTLEWVRALNFDARRFPQLEAASQARLDELLTQMAGKRVRIASLLERTADATREVEILQLDIARLRVAVDRLRTSAQRSLDVAADSSLGTPQWPSLPSGVTQFTYAIDAGHAYLWVRDASGIRAAMLAATPAEIARELSEFGKAIRARTPSRVDTALSRLSARLLPDGVLDPRSTILEIVADGQIARVPFAALRLPSEPARRLSQRQSIVMIGSLFEARIGPPLIPRHKWGFVALANDVRSKSEAPAARVFSVLPAANAEARSIAAMFQNLDPPPQVKLLFGAEGNASSLKAMWHDGVGAIHFATHGLADLRQPLASLLLLPALDTAGNPTYLTAGQVQEWRGDADLVYLSACETAVGPARFADGLPGLQRAFLRAGARGVVATLWPVEDVYASQFATDFYRRYTGGMSASQSLSETQRAWMEPAPGIRESEQAHRRMTAWAHAYYAQ